MSYQVGVDLGTTYTAAAVFRDGADRAEPVPLGVRSAAMASAVFAADGSFLVGEAAERRALADPARVVREFKRRIGDGVPVLVGREPVPAEVLAARFIRQVVDGVVKREGARPARVAVTHPAAWGPHKVESMRAALSAHGVAPVLLLTEPQAAAVGYASAERVEPGAVVAVYDLGGGTFDAAVVRKEAGGGFELLGTPEGLERLGGVDFDDAVFTHVRTALGPAWDALDPTDPEVLAGVARLRRDCTAAKEALSEDTEVLVPVLLPGLHAQVRLGRMEFEEMIRPALLETVEAMRRAISSAGVAASDLSALLLVGGSSRIPLVTQLVSAGIGRPASVDVDPKAVIAAGAALVAGGSKRPAEAPPAPVPAPVPKPVPLPPAPPVPVLREEPEPDERPASTLVAAAVRPPKQFSPFPGGEPARLGRRGGVIALIIGAIALALLGGGLALASSGGGGNKVAPPPPPPVSTAPEQPAAPVQEETPARRPPRTEKPAPTEPVETPTEEPKPTPTPKPAEPSPTPSPTPDPDEAPAGGQDGAEQPPADPGQDETQPPDESSEGGGGGQSQPAGIESNATAPADEPAAGDDT
jgi:actin-like ATPase involved in cell morphogenesis